MLQKIGFRAPAHPPCTLMIGPTRTQSRKGIFATLRFQVQVCLKVPSTSVEAIRKRERKTARSFRRVVLTEAAKSLVIEGKVVKISFHDCSA